MDGMPQLPNTVRFFVDPASIDAGSTTDVDLIHQWQRVLRLRIGADVLLLDGAGMQVHVVLTELTAKLARWEQRATAPAGGEPTQHVTLCAALIRPERYEWLLQKSVELGVSRIVPLLCERSRVDAPVTANKRARWQRIVTEAAEQSCRGILPDSVICLCRRQIRCFGSMRDWIHDPCVCSFRRRLPQHGLCLDQKGDSARPSNTGCISSPDGLLPGWARAFCVQRPLRSSLQR
jgi:hypothetical protein